MTLEKRERKEEGFNQQDLERCRKSKNLMEILTCTSGNLNLAKCKARTGFLALFPYLESFHAGTV